MLPDPFIPAANRPDATAPVVDPFDPFTPRGDGAPGAAAAVAAVDPVAPIKWLDPADMRAPESPAGAVGLLCSAYLAAEARRRRADAQAARLLAEIKELGHQATERDPKRGVIDTAIEVFQARGQHAFAVLELAWADIPAWRRWSYGSSPAAPARATTGGARGQ